ncbi:MAG: GNAT family N-acetyltransferase [Rhodopirellula sp.]|nr:GNAT family N-acetyltransferase [Rhodopirellula sp.]
MGQIEATVLDSVDQIRQRAETWDRLWQRSEVTLPTARADLVRLWTGCFAPKALFRGICIEEGGELRAVLPLVGRRVRGVVPAGDLTWNCWSASGELLLDPLSDNNEIATCMVAAARRLPWPVLWLETAPYETPRWICILSAFATSGCPADCHHRYDIGQVEIRESFEDYLNARPKQFLRTLRKDHRRLERTGALTLKVYSPPEPGELSDLLATAFEMERQGWKGRAGGAVVNHPGVFEFYLEQARRLADWKQCLLAFLLHQGRPIAFDFGWTAKGVYHSFKVGYDEQYRQWSPGHVLRMLLIEHFHREPGWRLIDFQGPLTDALAAWSTRTYKIGRVAVGLKPLRGRLFVSAAGWAAALRRRGQRSR